MFKISIDYAIEFKTQKDWDDYISYFNKPGGIYIEDQPDVFPCVGIVADSREDFMSSKTIFTMIFFNEYEKVNDVQS